MDYCPYNFVVSDGFKKLKNKNIHRTFFENDLKYFCKGFKYIFDKYGNLENLFLTWDKKTNGSSREQKFSSLQCDVWKGFYLFREEMAKANKGGYSIHVSNAGKENENGSACKKLNLALRWLVREGPVDLGLWKKIKPSALYIPLDVHVARTARKMGLLKRKSNDKKSVIMLTENYASFVRKTL